VDEALAVGDEAFQRKCFARIHRFQEAGGTLLFVSHSAPAVLELCHRAVLLDQGELLLSGAPKDVVTQYHRLIYAPPAAAARLREELRQGGAAAALSPSPTAGRSDTGGPERDGAFHDPHLAPRSTLAYESRGALIEAVCVRTPAGRLVNVLQQRRDYVYEYAVRFTQDCFGVRFGMLIKTTSGLELGGAVTAQPPLALASVEAGSRLTVRFRFRCLLSEGTYFLNAGVVGMVDGAETFLHRIVDVAMIRVLPDPEALATGTVDFCAEPELLVDARTPEPTFGW
jgi:lipopolysaccharide transport system ATP-binding protein